MVAIDGEVERAATRQGVEVDLRHLFIVAAGR
jgi:hypothetical protein